MLDDEERAELESRISEWVGHAFFGVLLREFRATLNRNDPLAGGRAGTIFNGQLDQELLSRLGRSDRFAIGTSIAKSWLGTQ